MGYYTTYNLYLDPEDYELLAEIWNEENKNDESGFTCALEAEGNCADSVKWYDWEIDMRRISTKYPDTLFHLHGEGGETGDIWEATFKGGKAHIRRAKIEIEPFDPTKLI